MPKQFLSINEAAARLGVSTKTLRRWEEKGIISPKRTVGNQRRYSLSDIEKADKQSLTINEAAQRLGLSAKTLRRWEEKGIIAPERTSGNQRRYAVAEIEKLKDKNPKAIVTPRIKKQAEKDLSALEKERFFDISSVKVTAEPKFRPVAADFGPVVRERPFIPTSNPKSSFRFSQYINRQSLQWSGAFLSFVAALLFINSLSQVSLPVKILALLPYFNSNDTTKNSKVTSGNEVLATQTKKHDYAFKVSVPAEFLKTASVSGKLTAPNILYSVVAGNNITISGDKQNPTISANLNIDAGTGLAIADGTITNTDTGSSQKIFGSIKVGSDTITAGSNTDSFELAAGDNVTLTTDTSNKKITISSTGSSGSNTLDVLEDGTSISNPASKLNFLGGDFDISESPPGQANVQLASTLTSVTGVAGNFAVGGSFTVGSDTISNFTGTNSGLEVTGGALSLLTSCADNEILKYTTLGGWACSTDAGTGAAVGGIGAQNQVAFWTNATTLSGSNNFYWQSGTEQFAIGTNGTPIGKFTLNGAVAGKALAVLNETGDQNILTASASGITQLNLDRSGNLAIEGAISDLSGPVLTINDDLKVAGNDIIDSADVTRITLGATNTITGSNLTLAGTSTLDATSLTMINGGATAINFNEFDVSGTTGSITIDDDGNAGNITVEGTRLDIDSLDFVASGAITTGAGNDLTITPGGNNVLFGDGTTLNVGGAGQAAYNFFADSTAGATLPASDNDLYIQGDLEVDGQIRFNNQTYTFPATAGSNGNVLTTNGSGTLSWTDTSSFGINYWDQLSGVLTPKIETQDLLLGSSATSSAKFAFTNVLTGTPTASISAITSGNALSFDATGNIATTNKQTLTLGSLSTGNIVIGNLGFTSCSALETNNGILTCGTDDVGSAGTNYWQLNQGAISPFSETLDVLIGSTATSSAQFALTGIAAGNPTASLSATTNNNGLSLNASNSQIQSLNKNNLILGGNTTGNIVLSGFATGVLHSTNGVLSSSDVLLGTETSGNYVATITGNSQISVSGSGSENAGVSLSIVADSIGDSQLAFDTGQNLTNTSSPTFNGLSLTSLTVNGDTINDFTGTGLQVVGSALQATLGTDIALNSSETTGILPTNKGGTGADLSAASQYSIPYFSAAGVLGGALAPSTAGYVLTTNSTGAAPSWVSAASLGTNYWDSLNGVLTPKIETQDLLLGSNATQSAKFAFTNVLTGTPTASISAVSTNNALSLDAGGNIFTTNKQTLTLGGTSTGNILIDSGTGLITLADNTTISQNLTVAGGNIAGPNGENINLGQSTDGTIIFSGAGGSNNKNFILDLESNSAYPVLTSDDGTIGINAGLEFVGAQTISSTNNLSFDVTGNLTLDTTGNITLSDFNNCSTLSTVGTTLTCSSGSSISNWNIMNGTIQPKFASTLDLLIGGTATNSAKFAFINVNSGTPTASISAITTGNALSFDAAGNIFTTNKQTLTLGSASTGNIVIGNTGLGSCSALETNNGVLTCGTDDVGSAGTNYWQLTQGAISPFSETLDVLIGSTATSSAEFALTGIAAGTPTASLSATTNSNGLSLNASNSTFQSLNNASLTIGGNTTGNIVLSGRNGSSNSIYFTGYNCSSFSNGGTLTVDANGLVQCAADDSSTGAGTLDIQEGGAGIVSGATILNFAASDFAVTTPGGTQGDVAIDYGNSGIVRRNNNEVIGGQWSFLSDLLVGGTSTSSAKFAVLNMMGVGTPTASLSGTTGGAFLTATGTLQTTNNQSLTLGGGNTGNIVIPSLATGVLHSTNGVLSSSDVLLGTETSGNYVASITGNSQISVSGSGSENAGVSLSIVADSIGDSQLAFNTGQNLTTSSTPQFAGLTVNSDTITDFTGTGLAMSGNSLTTTLGVSVDLTSEVNGILPSANGGTGADLSAAAQYSIPYFTTGGVLSYLAPSTDGYVLTTHNGSGAPTWTNAASVGTNYWDQIGGVLTPKIETQDLLLGGQATSSAQFAVTGLATGTPTATLSATANNGYGLSLTASSATIQSLNKGTLTIGGASTGNIVLDAGSNLITLSDPTSLSSTLSVSGTITANGDVILGDAITDNITFTGRIAQDSDIIPITTTGTNDLGSASLPWDNLYVGTVTQNGATLDATYAPINANFITVTANGTLTGETGIDALTTAISTTSTLNVDGASTLGAVTLDPNANLILSAGTGKLGIGVSSPLAAFDVHGNSGTTSVATISGNTSFAGLVVDNSIGDLFTASSSGLSRFTIAQNGTIYTNGIAGQTVGTASCVTTTNGIVTGTSACPSVTANDIWQTGSGTIFQGNTTQDLLIGGTSTASAKFAVLNVNPGSGTPTASISGTTGAVYLSADGILTTTNKQSLTFGTSATGNINLGTDATQRTITIGNTTSGTALNLDTGTGGINIGDNANIKTIDIGGVNSSGTDTINIATNGTAADSITIGNSNASTTLALTGGTAWSIATSGLGTFSQVNVDSLTLNNTSLSSTGDLILDATGGDVVSSDRFTIGSQTATNLATLDVRALSGTLSVATVSGKTSFASLVIDNSGAGDIFTASASGQTRLTLTNAGELRFYDADSSNYTGFKTPTNITSNSIYTFPTALPASNNYVLVSQSDGTLSWVDAGTLPSVNFWNSANGALSPKNAESLDLLLGSTATSSAEFAVTGISAGAPVATLSATTNNTGLSLTASNATIQSLNKGTLTIGGSTTGNISLANLTIAGAGLTIPSGQNFTLSGFTQGSVPFIGANGVLSQNNTSFFFDDTNNRLGIGVNSNLAATLDIRATSGTLPTASLSGNTSFAGLIVDNSGTGDLFTASSSGLSRFVIAQNGNVGIGTNLPTQKLDVAGNATASGSLTLGGVFQVGAPLAGPVAYNRIGYATTSHGLNASNDLFISGRLEVDGSLFVDGNIIPGGTTGTVGWLQRNGGALAPTNLTDDLLLGSISTTSARFAFTNAAGPGTPTASIAAITTDNALSLDANGNIGTTNEQTLNLGTTSTGNINLVVGTGNNLTINGVSGVDVLAATCVKASNGIITGTGSCDSPISSFIWSTSSDNKAIIEGNTTRDLLIGGLATESAKFAVLNVAGSLTPIASLSAGTAGGTFLTADGNLQTTAYQTLSLGGGNTGNIAITTKGGYGGAGTLSINGQTGATSASLTCVSVEDGIVTAVGGCGAGAGGSVWTVADASGVIYPQNPTLDLLIGGISTASAKFAVLNVAGSQTPVASVSAGTAGAAFLTADGNLQTTAKQSLTLGGGDTGDIVLSGFSTGIIHSTDGVLSSSAISLTSDITGTLGVGNGGTGNTSLASGALFFGAGGNTALNTLTIGSVNTCLLSSGTAPTWGNCALGTNYWQSVNAGTITPYITTVDTLFGGVATSSATLRIAGSLNAGTGPAASLSARSSFAGLLVDNTVGDLFTASSSGQSRFVITQAGNVGIGTTLPTADLNIVQKNVKNPALLITAKDGGLFDANTFEVDDSTGSLAIGYIDESKQTWIKGGTSFYGTPALLVQATNGVGPALKVGGGVTAPIGSTAPTASISANSSFATLLVDNMGSGDLFTASSAGLSRFVITQAGNVGIGTTTPSKLLEISGTGNVTERITTTTNGAEAGLEFIRSASNNVDWKLVATGADNFGIRSSTDDFLTNTTRLYITSGGKVGIGTNTNTPNGTLEINAVSGTIPVASIAGATSFASMIIDNSGSGDLFTASSSGLTRFVIKQNGNIGIGTTLPTAMLDVAGTASVASSLTFRNGASSIQTTANNTLTLGGSTTGNISIENRVVTSTGDLILDPFDEVYLANGKNIVIGGHPGNVNYNVIANSANTSHGLNTDADLFIEGSLEVDGVFYADGGIDTALSQGFVVFPDANGVLTQDTSNFYYDDANNRLGVGVASNLLGTLDLRGTSDTLAVASISGKSNSFATMVVDNQGRGDLFTASSSGLNRFVIKNNGNVGIGTSTPNAALHIDADGPLGNLNNAGIEVNAKLNMPLISTNSADAKDVLNNIWPSNAVSLMGNYQAGGSKGFLVGQSTSSSFGFQGITTPGGYDTYIGGFWDNWASSTGPGTNDGTFIRLSDGEIDFYTDAPHARLDSSGNFILRPNGVLPGFSYSPATLDIIGDSSGLPVASISGSTSQAALLIDNSGSGDIFNAFSSGLERFTIQNNGNVGIGTTSPSELLHVRSSDATGSTFDTVFFGDDNTGNKNAIRLRVKDTAVGVSFADIAADYSGVNGSNTNLTFSTRKSGAALAEAMRITNNLNVGIGTTTPLATLNVMPSNINGGTLAIASVSGRTSFAALVADNSGAGDIFTASSSGLQRFTIKQNGQLQLDTVAYNNCTALATVNGLLTCGAGGTTAVYNANGASGVGTATDSYTDMGGTSSLSFTKTSSTSKLLIQVNTGGYVAISAATAMTVGVNINSTDYDCGTFYFNTLSQHDAFSCSILLTGISAGNKTVQIRWKRNGGAGSVRQDTNDWNSLTVQEVEASSDTSLWELNSGAIVQKNVTEDLLIGGVSSTSARFHVFGSAALAGTTPVASVSGNTAQAAFIVDNRVGDIFTASSSGLPRFVIRQNGNVSIGGGSEFNTSSYGLTIQKSDSGLRVRTSLDGGTLASFGGEGDFSIDAPNLTSGRFIVTDNGLVGINSTSPLASLDVRGNFATNPLAGTQPTASIGAKTSFAGLVIDNTIGDLFTASSSGLPRFTIKQNGNVEIGSNNYLNFNGTSDATAYIRYSSAFDTIGITKASGTIQTASTNFFIKTTGGTTYFTGDGANLRVGINTSSPLVALDARSTSGTLATASISANSSFASLVADNRGVGDLFTASSSGLSRFTINQNGHIAIGTPSALATLQLRATDTFNPFPAMDYGSVALGDIQTPTSRATGIAMANSTGGSNVGFIGFNSDRLFFGAFSSATSSNNSKMALDTTTNQLGLNVTSNMRSTLDVRGSTLGNGGTLSIASFSGATSFAGLVVDNSGTGDLFTASSSGLNRFVINQNGNVGIGLTTTLAKLDIKDTLSNSTVGSEKITNANDQTFAAAGNWTTLSGPAWKINIAGSGVAAKDAPGQSTISLPNAALDSAPVAGNVYQVTFDYTTTASSSGTLTPTLGSLGGKDVGQGASQSKTSMMQVFVAVGTNALQFQASSGWYGTIDNVSVKQITTTSMALRLESSDGTSSPIEFRTGGSGRTNIFIGQDSGSTTTTSGSSNTGVGYRTLASNIIGDYNSAFGTNALQYSTNGFYNSAFGANALNNNVSGDRNSAVGYSALASNSVGFDNAAFGANALSNNGSGSYNNAFGSSALQLNSTGSANVAFGYNALRSSNGNNNVAIGYQAGYTNNGQFYNLLGSNNTYIGWNAGPWSSGTSATFNNATAIGAYALVNASNSLVLGGTGQYAVNVGIGTASPSATLDIRGNIGTQPVASIAGNTSFAGLVVNNSGSGDLFTASAGGQSRFTVTQAGNVRLQGDMISFASNSAAITNDGSISFVNALGDQGSIVPNASFEASTSAGLGFADGWVKAASSSGALIVDNQAASHGSNSIKAVLGANGQAVFYSPCFPLSSTAQSIYKLSLHAKASVNGPTVLSYIDGYTSKANCAVNNLAGAGVSNAVVNATVTTSWQGMTPNASATPATGAQWGRVHILIGAGVATNINIDAIRLTPASTTFVTGLDYAEMYPANPNNIPQSGDVVMLEASNGATMVVPANKSMDQSVIGVVSTQPGQTLDDGTVPDPKVPVALAGRIPVKVSAANGPIHVGDYLTSSDIPGVAVKANKPGMVIGKAMESYSQAGIGSIIVFANLSNYDPYTLTNAGNISLFEKEDAPTLESASTYGLSLPDGSEVIRTGIFSDAVIGNLKTGSLDVQSLSIGGTNVNDKLIGLEGGIASLSAGFATPLANLQNQVLSLSDRVASLEASLATLTASNSGLFMNNPLGNFTASSTAELSLDKLNVNGTILADSLRVIHDITTNNIAVNGTITSGLIKINGATGGISTLNGDLKLQDQGFGGIDILNGLVTIDTLGNITSQGTVTAKKFNVDTTDVSAASAGTGTITAGTKTTIINTSAVTADSIIQVTFTSDYSPATRYWIKTKTTGQSFTIQLDQPVTANAKFTWFIVN